MELYLCSPCVLVVTVVGSLLVGAEKKTLSSGYVLNGIVVVYPYTTVVHRWDAAISVSHYSHLLQEAPLCG